MRSELEFAACFAEVWSRPTPERLLELLHPEVVLHQPHLAPIRGTAAARAEFERLFQWLPELYGAVERSCGRDGYLFIEWQMHFPIAGRRVTIPAVDRFRLADGLGIERVVFFDQLPLIAAVLRYPRAWPGYLRYRYGR